MISPCVGLCKINSQGYCRGCWRTLEEIMNWQSLPDEEKDAIVEQQHDRQEEQERL